jgi:hypothetical protein
MNARSGVNKCIRAFNKSAMVAVKMPIRRYTFLGFDRKVVFL